ncbi:extracellular solute-binding protein [Paenibacillus sp. GD4]|uniref:extracellular solute-binding protein n=1 Tax=Paenibacillus sp. GD4 TaxID=3068890 RepID=UPI002796BE55|nr:extracellular solute-binding protein [Paenibacillus sp. GD4]MDQ1913460.1 extracellular solute-binding protein [Paenibacillus sp. GD4]
MGRIVSLLLLTSLLTVAGCSVSKPAEPEPSAKEPDVAQLTKDPVTLNFYRYFTGLTDDEFAKYIVEPVKLKFPNVTLNFVKGETTGNMSPENILSTGNAPDIIFTSNFSLMHFRTLQYPIPLDPEMKRSNLDLAKFDPVVIDALRKYGDNGEIYALPFTMNLGVLFYNKDIFDRFGVPYPKESSTWEDILELSKKLTRTDGGVQYRGVVLPGLNVLADQRSVPYADAKTKKSTATTHDQWPKIMQLMKQFYEIPGVLDSTGKVPPLNRGFVEERTTAMWPQWDVNAFGILADLEKKGAPINWDMTTQPSHKELPGVGRRVDFQIMMVSQASKNQQLAFEVIKHLSTYEPLHTEMTKNAKMTVLGSEEIRKQFGSNLSLLKGKNVASILKTKPAPLAPVTPYDSALSSEMNTAFNEVASGAKDINTALMRAQESADKKIVEIGR